MPTYYIDFDTKDMPGAIRAVRVRLDEEVVRDHGRALPVNLCEDALYEKLEKYVLANPSKKRRKT